MVCSNIHGGSARSTNLRELIKLKIVNLYYKNQYLCTKITFTWHLYVFYQSSLPTVWPVKQGRVFLVPCKKGLVQCTLLYKCTLDKSLFTRYQKHMAMFNWSPCTWAWIFEETIYLPRRKGSFPNPSFWCTELNKLHFKARKFQSVGQFRIMAW